MWRQTCPQRGRSVKMKAETGGAAPGQRTPDTRRWELCLPPTVSRELCRAPGQGPHPRPVSWTLSPEATLRPARVQQPRRFPCRQPLAPQFIAPHRIKLFFPDSWSFEEGN